MRTTKLQILLCTVLILLTQKVSAQDYKEYAKSVRDEVWTWDLPAFKNYQVPEQYKNESAVILATHDQILATGKTKLRVKFGLDFKMNKELLYTNTNRTMILINDKVSLDKYSSMSFKEQEKISGYMMSSKFKTIIGARIIKPDGKIIDVDVEDEAVEMTEGKKDKVDHKKLAISNLAVGDILDYFYQYEGHVDAVNIPPMNFIFGAEYPILYYSIHCEIGRKLTVEYRPINGAPDFEEYVNDNRDVVLDVEKKDIPKVEGYNRWSVPLRQLPIIRMSILNNASKDIWKPKSAREQGLHKNVPAATIIKDKKYSFNSLYLNSDNFKQAKKQIKEYKKNNPNYTKKELALYIYDLSQHIAFYSRYNTNSSYLSEFLRVLFNDNKISYSIHAITDKGGARMDEVANRYDLELIVAANDGSQIFPFNTLFNLAGYSTADFEGERGQSIYSIDFDRKGTIESNDKILVPVTDENFNQSITKLDVSFTDDPLVLEIDHETRNKGSLKKNYQYRFFTNVLWSTEMRERLQIEKSLLEEMESDRKQRKDIEDRKAMDIEEAKELKNRFKEELKSYYDTDPKEIIEHKVEHLGITPKNPDFISKVKYTQEGLVQKAGNNLILNVGKLIGGQLELKGKDRDRTIDIYLSTARTFEYNIVIPIAENYSVENIESLNMHVDNESGAFISSATMDGNNLIVNVTKTYKKAFLPVAEWDHLLEMLDATIKFKAQSVILRKK